MIFDLCFGQILKDLGPQTKVSDKIFSDKIIRDDFLPILQTNPKRFSCIQYMNTCIPQYMNTCITIHVLHVLHVLHMYYMYYMYYNTWIHVFQSYNFAKGSSSSMTSRDMACAIPAMLNASTIILVEFRKPISRMKEFRIFPGIPDFSRNKMNSQDFEIWKIFYKKIQR